MIISLGFTYAQFAILPTDSLSINNSDKATILSWEQSVRESGHNLIVGGLVMAIVVMAVFSILIWTYKSKSKFNKSKKRILFDEMYDGKDMELAKRGYDAHSVKKLRLTGEPLRYDYSVLKYIEKNKMILITEDPESHGGCQENNLPCIKLGQNPSIDEIIKALESL